MKLYELTYLISADLGEEEVKAFQEKVISLIQEEEGILTKANSPVRKTLAYPIKKRDSAYLATLIFQLKPERLENLKKKLKGEDNILRYLILTKKPPKETTVAVPRKPKKVIKPKPKVELKEIEKKLEEILRE